MTLSRWLRGAALLGAVLALPAQVRAQVFSDGTMNTWNSTVVINPYGCSSGGSFWASAGGKLNPIIDPYLGVWNYDCGTLVGVGHLSSFTWNPFSQGAITSPITFKWDGIHYSGGQMAFEALLRQGGKWYMAPVTYSLATTGNGWEALGGTAAANQWCEVFAGFGPPNGYACGSSLPDFTASGGTIEFGVMALNSGSYSRQGGIDNYEVDFVHGPGSTVAPEPASIFLVASGLAGVAFVGRRRRPS